MSVTYYTAVLSELYAHIVMQRPYQEIASLVLRGTTYSFDTHRVLDDVRELALETAKSSPDGAALKLFNQGLEVFRRAFDDAAYGWCGDPSLYEGLGFKMYFEKKPVVLE